MTSVNIPLFELGKSNKNFHDICSHILKVKNVKQISADIITAGGACLAALFDFSPKLLTKYNTQLNNILSNNTQLNNILSLSNNNTGTGTGTGTNTNTNTNNNVYSNRYNNRFTSFQFNLNKNVFLNIPTFYAAALNNYILVCSSNNYISKITGATETSHRTSINSASDLITTIANMCNIILPLCKRKKIDCFHIQGILKIIYLGNLDELDKLFIKTINSTAKILVNHDSISNTVKSDPMISKTVTKFNIQLNNGITLTNEAAIYLSMFILSLNPDIIDPDKLITISTKTNTKTTTKTASKKQTPSTSLANTPLASTHNITCLDPTDPNDSSPQTKHHESDANLIPSPKLTFTLKI